MNKIVILVLKNAQKIKNLLQFKLFQLFFQLILLLISVFSCQYQDVKVYQDKKQKTLIILADTDIYLMKLILKSSIEIEAIMTLLKSARIELQIYNEEELLNDYLSNKYAGAYSELVINHMTKQYLTNK